MAAGYLDKAYIVFILGAASLTYYTVPFDIISRFFNITCHDNKCIISSNNSGKEMILNRLI